MQFKGTAHRYGRDVDTDVIIPARYLNTSDPAELAKHCLEDLDKSFIERVQPGDIIVADENFGCGSSREHAAVALKAAGVSAVVAESFARIFFRNGVNLGIPLVTCAGVSQKVKDGDRLVLDLSRSLLKNETSGEELPCEPVGDYALTILEAGGIKLLLKELYGRR